MIVNKRKYKRKNNLFWDLLELVTAETQYFECGQTENRHGNHSEKVASFTRALLTTTLSKRQVL